MKNRNLWKEYSFSNDSNVFVLDFEFVVSVGKIRNPKVFSSDIFGTRALLLHLMLEELKMIRQHYSVFC